MDVSLDGPPVHEIIFLLDDPMDDVVEDVENLLVGNLFAGAMTEDEVDFLVANKLLDEGENVDDDVENLLFADLFVVVTLVEVDLLFTEEVFIDGVNNFLGSGTRGFVVVAGFFVGNFLTVVSFLGRRLRLLSI